MDCNTRIPATPDLRLPRLNHLFLSITLAFCSALPLRATPISLIEGATPKTILGGADNLNILNGATHVEVFRIVPENKVDGRKRISIDGRNCESPGKIVSGREFRKAVSAFAEVTNFGHELMCDFDPGIILRFQTDTGILDVVVCFHCHEMMLYRDGEIVRRDFKWAESRNTFFWDAGAAFTAVAKKAFPKDWEIKSLRP